MAKGNPMSEMRFRRSIFINGSDDSLDSEWEATRDDAIKHGAKSLIRKFEKFGETNLIVKIFNEMNHKQKPIVITFRDAKIMFPK